MARLAAPVNDILKNLAITGLDLEAVSSPKLSAHSLRQKMKQVFTSKA
jgi:hypothetical protein